MRAPLVLWLPILAGCGPPVPAPSSASARSSQVTFEPAADPSAVPSVVRIRVASATLAAGAVSLFRGPLSSYYLARIKSGDLPATLAPRQIPIASWRADSELVVAPLRALLADRYSLASASGVVTEFQVAGGLPTLTRVWPTVGSGGGVQHAVYCGDGSAPLSPSPLLFEPGEIAVSPSLGVDDDGLFGDRCVHFASDAALAVGALAVPPPLLGGWALDPAPFSGASPEPAAALSCARAEVVTGFGCASIADDRATVRTPDAALLWIVHSERGAFLDVTTGGASLLIRALNPGGSERLWGHAYDASGAQLDFDLPIITEPARERPVLSEVLANSLGPEPQSEWIELVNDGQVALDLAHYALRDSGGSRPLPEASLAPGEYALLVRDDFAPSASDVPPAPGARLIRVAELGTSGLSNAGESLALVDSAGTVVSALPPISSKAGQSLARLHSFSRDDDPSAFSTGTPTPGAPND